MPDVESFYYKVDGTYGFTNENGLFGCIIRVVFCIRSETSQKIRSIRTKQRENVVFTKVQLSSSTVFQNYFMYISDSVEIYVRQKKLKIEKYFNKFLM